MAKDFLVFTSTSYLCKRSTGTIFIPSSTPTNTPTATPCATPTSTPTPTPTPTSIDIAISYLQQYTPTGLAQWNYLVSIGNDHVEYNTSLTTPCNGQGGNPIVVAAQSCNFSPTRIAGTIAHEAVHILLHGDSLWEEYQAFFIGDVVRSEIIQAGKGVSSDMIHQFSLYTVNIANPNKTQLAQDLTDWFLLYHDQYVLVWNVQPLP